MKNNNHENTLVIADTHFPFEHEEYLEHCIKTKKKYKCTRIIHSGDLIDNSQTTHWDINCDEMSAGHELKETINKIKDWKKAFPEIYVCLGNHDLRILKKSNKAGIASSWIKDFSTLFNTPKWHFNTEWNFNGVKYIHGDGISSLNSILSLVLNRRSSFVCGHLHTTAGIIYNSNEKDILFGMIVGSGIDFKKYSFNYARNYIKTPIISCGVIIEDKYPLIIPYN